MSVLYFFTMFVTFSEVVWGIGVPYPFYGVFPSQSCPLLSYC